MKKLFINLRMAFLAVALIASTNACTDLTEKLYSEIPADQFYQTQDQIDGAVKAIYTGLYGMGNHGAYWSGQENSSDESLIPTRGSDWYDGGQWLNAARHTTNANDGFLNGAWGFSYKPIATCNRLLIQIPKAITDVTKSDPIINEVKVMRALYYSFLLDQFGNVPLFISYPTSNDEFVTKPRADVFAFIEGELKAAIASGKLSTAKNYGKVNVWAAKAILARLYLNAEVYTGTARWADTKALADDLIKNSPYKLDETTPAGVGYYNNFKTNNESSIENIFVIPFDEVTAQGFNFHQMALHYNNDKTFNLVNQPWNGYCSLQEFYNSYDSTDARKANFLVGQQFQSDGKTPCIDPGAFVAADSFLNFKPEINELYPKAGRGAGVRMIKFKPKLGQTSSLDNDFPLYRIGEMYLIRAEAAFRLSAGDATALADVNKIRARAGVAPYTALTAANILAERGREMAFEGVRRPDMIRFGVYSNSYRLAKNEIKPADDDAAKRKVYPIPQVQLDANPKLRQNTGY